MAEGQTFEPSTKHFSHEDVGISSDGLSGQAPAFPVCVTDMTGQSSFLCRPKNSGAVHKPELSLTATQTGVES